MRLQLIRHGASEHSVLGVIADIKGCTGMTEEGRRQVARLAARMEAKWRLQPLSPPVLLSSPVRRALETAQALQRALGAPEIRPDADLRELIPGEADGLQREEHLARHGQFDMIALPDRAFAPGGESWNGFLARVRSTLDRLAATYGDQSVVVATHAGFIVAAMIVLFGIPRPGTGTRLEPTNAGITTWEYSPGRWRLVAYDDAAHLDPAPASDQ